MVILLTFPSGIIGLGPSKPFNVNDHLKKMANSRAGQNLDHPLAPVAQSSKSKPSVRLHDAMAETAKMGKSKDVAEKGSKKVSGSRSKKSGTAQVRDRST